MLLTDICLTGLNPLKEPLKYKMLFMKILLFSLLFFILSDSFSQGHKIKVILKDADDTTLTLACYYGEKIKPVEKAVIKKSGKYLFASGKKLPYGVCMVLNGNNEKLFEFISGEDQFFTISARANEPFKDLKVKGSKENKRFFKYLDLNKNVYKKILELNDKRKNGEDSVFFERQKDSLLNILKEERENIEKKLPGSLLSELLKAGDLPELPDTIKNKREEFEFYKRHYWDNFDLSDKRLLHTPLYDKKLGEYFDVFVPRQPDSVIKVIDVLIAKAGPDSEAVSHLVWYFTSKYRDYGYMGFDKVFVHMVDKYFSKYDMENVTPSILTVLKQRADRLRPVLTGKKAPNLIMIDTSGNYKSFLTLKNDFVIILFWDYNCGVCKKEIQILKKELFNNNKFDVAVFAVNVNSDLNKWKKELKNRGIREWINVNGTESITGDFHQLYDVFKTPSLYLLNKDKIIIAKNIKPEKLMEFINLYVNKHY